MPHSVKKDFTAKHDIKKSGHKVVKVSQQVQSKDEDDDEGEVNETTPKKTESRKDDPLNRRSQPEFKQTRRASPDEKKVQRVARNLGVNLNRRGATTRLSKQKDTALSHAVTLINNNNNVSDNELLQKAMNHAALEQKKPPKKVGQKPIFNGSRRGFEPDFSDAFWKKYTGTKCPKCQETVTRENGEIDHKTSWSQRQHFADPIQVCFQQRHWEVVLVEDMYQEYQDMSNLQPMCKTCNASKNGMKGNDLAIPTIIGNCDGKCSLRQDCT